jgi:hypothetical protein
MTNLTEDNGYAGQEPKPGFHEYAKVLFNLHTLTGCTTFFNKIKIIIMTIGDNAR